MDNTIKYVSLSELIPGEFQPHVEETNDNLENLTNSIKSYGILVPLIVRPKGIQYEIILGNRRYNAAKILGLKKIPVIVLDVDDEKALDLIIADNIQRKELTGKEEAYLYDKALEYPNTNKEKLSISLGIPIDRITSKLNLLKKDNKKNIPNTSNNQNFIPNIEHKNFINNDIINLNDLNKERNDSIMNNNQFVNNITTDNNNQSQQPSQQPSLQQAPTFGGRFFPSLEDEPTNMDLNTGFSNPMPINNPTGNLNEPQTNSPLIDLTDTTSQISQPSPTTNIQNPSPIVDNLNSSPLTSEINPQPNSEFISGINTSTTSMPIQENDLPTVPTENIINDNNQINSPIEQPINDTLVQQPAIDQQSYQIPNLTDTLPQQNLNILESQPNDSSNITAPTDIASLNSISEVQQDNAPSIPNLNQVEAPISPIEQPNIDQQINIPNININDIPNLTATQPIDNQIPSPIEDINAQAPLSISQKDIIPVVNMIKNLAIGIKELGYNLNIIEDDEQTSYKITIEVEK